MKKLILIAIVIVGCNHSVVKKDDYIEPIKKPPSWIVQNIDSEPSCNIIPCPEIKIIKVGNTYTATYTFVSPNDVWFKMNKQNTGLDFAFGNYGAIQYFNDSCSLKNDLRAFIKLQMVKYISNIPQ